MDSLCCALCLQAEETQITGALSTKDAVTAHQNCLLYSSGIFCRDSPQFDDLFGFSVDDVIGEVRRGNKLICSHCKKKGATAGCEVVRCKKSFHYPCAVTAGAKIIEDADEGSYGLYCVRHSEPPGNNVSVNGIKTSKNYSDATPAEKRSSSGDSTAAGPVRSPSRTPSTSKRRRSFDDKLEEKTPKRRSEGWNGMVSDSSSDSADADMAMFAPLEFDSDSSANSVPEQVTRKDTKSSDSGHQQDSLSNGGSEDDPVAESQSLLPPVDNGTDPLRRSNTPTAQPVTVMDGEIVKEEEEFSPVMIDHTSEPTVPQQTSVSPPPSPDRSTAAPPETVSNPKPSIDSTRFWKSCNAAHCTQAVFADFIREMEGISSRIQSDEASQEDYDCALRVMEASGKLTALVIRQQEELVRKRSELQKAEAAVMEVLSALKR
ncbi:PHD finger protein 11 [Larimichthys crocea]|uniref:PHD finger protein 11 n=1 Tax=Larimichthys crocea TaxID=215358 RepID=A0A6G0J633_LARCR|nr:PHD finger protein 11 [Larimichthys crocea]